MTLREVFNAVNGYAGDKDILNKTLWETSRFQVMHLLSPHVKKGKQLKASDIIVFPWDKLEKKDLKKSIKKGKKLEKKWRKSIPR